MGFRLAMFSLPLPFQTDDVNVETQHKRIRFALAPLCDRHSDTSDPSVIHCPTG